MENQKTIKIGNFEIGNKLPLAIIAGPCPVYYTHMTLPTIQSV